MILINEIEIMDIPEENKFIVINLLNGNADILDIEYLDIIKNNKLTTLVNDEIKNCLIERNYILPICDGGCPAENKNDFKKYTECMIYNDLLDMVKYYIEYVY